jgi:hypothetical protein
VANKFTLKKGQTVTAKIGGVEFDIECDCDDAPPAPAQREADPARGLNVDGPGVRYLMAPGLAAKLNFDRLLREPDEVHAVDGPQVQVLLPHDEVFDLENPGLRAVLAADVDVDISMGPPARA